MTTIFVLVVTVGITISEAGESSKLYTAHNIWKASKMKCINFKQGTAIIPAGTEVKDVRLKKLYGGSPLLYFTTVQDGQKYSISFNQRWHPKKSMEDYKDMMFTTRNFEAQTEGLSEMEIGAIKKGVLVKGMSKRAVFICYGRPPEHFTPKLAAETWFYWMNRRDKVEIKFDQNGRLDLIDSKAAKAAETDESIIQSESISGTQKVGITISEAGESAKLYTAYNIWKASNMKCINFKQGTDIIAVGTEVQNVKLKTKLESNVAKPPDMRSYLINFTTVRDNRTFTIDFNPKWHPRKTIENYKDMMFTTKNFETLTEGLSETEIDAIKKGVLVKGMCKKAVLISYGPPPEHATPDQNANNWYYWMDKKQKIEITFDKDNKLGVGGQESTPEITKESKIETMAPKSQAGSASGAQVAAIPKIKVNKEEPWTGKWEVESSHQEGGGQWGLTQRGQSVVSTEDSYYKLNGKIKGNQLKGRIIDSYGLNFRFFIKISPDGQSFEGKIDRAGQTVKVKGMRKQ